MIISNGKDIDAHIEIHILSFRCALIYVMSLKYANYGNLHGSLAPGLFFKFGFPRISGLHNPIVLI